VADDLTQEAFARAWARWADVAADATACAWVRRVAVRAAIKHKQRQQDWDELRDHAAVDAESADLDASVIAALSALSPQQRAAIVLTIVDETTRR
jgi:RNA polymerase sigma-70 factor (ECF subfamily)